MLDIKKVPVELKSLPNWVLWRLEERVKDGKTEVTKVPYNARTGGGAMANNPSTWSNFLTAYTTMINEPSYIGLGFMLSDNIVCIDLDNKDGSMTDDEFYELLKDCLKEVPSYCEKSVSGKGYHIFAKGVLPEGYRKKKHVEMYDKQRFIAFTGDVVSTKYDKVIDAQAGLDVLHERYLGRKQTKTTILDDLPTSDSSSSLSVEKVLERAKNNDKFMALFEGNWKSLGFYSQSEADASFASMLAFYTGKDLSLMDEIFRASKLYREKFDRKQGGSTYGRITLESALQWATEIYQDDMVNGELVEYKLERELPAGEVIIFDKKHPKKNPESVVEKPEVEVVERTITPSRYTDTANAESLIIKYGDSIRYNFDNKVWYLWDGKVWKWDEKNKIKQYAEIVANEMLSLAKKNFDDTGIKNALRMLNSAGKNSMINEAQHQTGISIVNAECDTEKFYLNTHSGIYDLRNGVLMPHDKELYMTKISSTEIDQRKPELWLKFLDEIFAGDKDLIKYIQKSVGYTLSGSIKEQMIFILHGGGNNGKSVFVDTIQTMLGDYATSVPIEVLMEKKGRGNVETTLARIKGARMIHASENDEDDQINEGLIKQITGGEQVIGRFLYGNEFEYYPEYKLWLSTNNKPKVKGTDFGIWRRLVIIPFGVTIPPERVDKDLFEKLKNELPAILNWAIQGFDMYQKEGLTLPKSLIDEKDKYKRENDYISNFITDRIDKKDGYRVQASVVYKEYESWCKMTNSKLMSSIAFGKEFGKHFEKARESTGFVYTDCTIKTEQVEYTIKEFGGNKKDESKGKN